MRFVRLALLTSALTAGPAVAQTATTGGNLGAASAATGTVGTGSSTSSTTTSQSTASSGGATTNTTNTTTATPQISGATITGTTSTATGGGVDRSNFLGGTYSNPYYQGLFSNATGAPGQFGQALYGTTGGSASTTTGTRSASGNTSRTTTAGGANPLGTSASQTGGRQTTAGQFQGGGQLGGANSQFGGQIVPLPRNIAYSAVLRFPAPAVAPAQRLADVQAVLARSSMMTNPAGVTVVQDGTAFVLRGAVASEDEARLAEGMVRLTPGVRDVRNELTFPKE